MKKLFILVAAALLSISANAQWFVGGIVDLDIQGNKTVFDKTNTTKTTSFSFTFAPEVGYYLSDKLAVGALLSLSPRSSQGESSFRWSISPYVRYKFWGIKKFGICGQANVYVGTESSSNPYPTVNYGVNIRPVLTYALNEHFTFDAYIDCAGIGYNGSCTNNKDARIKTTTNEFGFTVASQGQLVGIGFHYNF